MSESASDAQARVIAPLLKEIADTALPDLSATDRDAPASPLPSVADDCPTCGGAGWVIDHAVECYESGDCIGCGGRQVQCEDPRGHADPCTRCDGLGNVWAGDGPLFCRHCTGGWVWRGATPAGWIGEAGP